MDEVEGIFRVLVLKPYFFDALRLLCRKVRAPRAGACASAMASGRKPWG
jgi:hypothetical protein